MAAVKFQNVSKIFGQDVRAVDHLDLDIRDEEFMVLVGPSGCGKTTALRMLAGLEEVTEGSIFIGDKKVNDLPPKDRDIAMVFQNYALYPHMSVYENIAFGLKLRELRGFWWQLTHPGQAKAIKKSIDERVREVAKMLDIEKLLARKPKELSGGQRQRVALGRAIVRKPKVFLMDEPLSNLDAKLRIQTRAELIRLHRSLKVTTIYVTHDQVEAMTMGHRIAVMRDGVLQQCDRPEVVYHSPVNLFVAGFIGAPPMNFLQGVVKAEGAGYAVDLGSCLLPIPSGHPAEGYTGREIIAGIRPESIFDASLPNLIPVTDQNRLKAYVDVLEPHGNQFVAYLKLGEHPIIATLENGSQVTEESEATFGIDLKGVHFFDPETEQRITPIDEPSQTVVRQ